MIPNSIILDQYSNPNNPLAHYEGTAEEIIEDCGDHLDMAVLGTGTGGTISGVAKKLKEKYPGIIIVGVDPLGSILADPSNLDHINEPYQVEGIGYDFIPKVFDRSLVDSWIVTKDSDSFQMARRLIRSEGLLCGGSSGSATWGAIQAIKAYNFHNDPSKRVLTILPDSVRNYMSKFLSSDWMFQHNFMNVADFFEEQGYTKVSKEHTISDIIKSGTSETFGTFSTLPLSSNDSISKVLNVLQNSDSSKQFPVIIDSSNKIVGNLDTIKLFQAILREGKDAVSSMDIKRFINKEFLLWKVTDDVELLFAAFVSDTPAFLIDANGKAILDEQNRVQSINPFKLI